VSGILYKTMVTITVYATCTRCKKTAKAQAELEVEVMQLTAAQIGEKLRTELAAGLTARGWTDVCGTCRDSEPTDKADCA
jgi:hypothetical protein